jgi:AcrR family transcriptional regulator
MTTVSEQTRARQKEETRQRVFDAALEIFRRDGVAEAKIDDVVKLAGVSRGTFYFHYPTKDDVLAEVLAQAERAAAEAIDALSARASLAQMLEALATAIMGQWQNEPQLFPEVGMLALKLTATGKLTHQSDPVRAAVTRRFRVAAERGELTGAVPAEQLADFFLLSAFAGLMTWAQQGEGTLETALKKGAKLFLDGARGSR